LPGTNIAANDDGGGNHVTHNAASCWPHPIGELNLIVKVAAHSTELKPQQLNRITNENTDPIVLFRSDRHR
jgi:hypothetical protein